MNEELLQFIWKHQLYDKNDLRVSDHGVIEIISHGYHNHHAGPDFLDARVKINDTLWAGNIEVHIKSSDWYKHHHQTDKAYDNVILHVVQEYDQDIFRQDGSKIPTLVLHPGERIHLKYDALLNSQKWIACEEALPHVDDMVKSSWLQKMTIERLESKVERVNQMATQTANNWEHVLWIFIARALGTNVNGEPFQRLLQQLPIQVLFKHLDNPLQIEALLFGTAGLLDPIHDDHYQQELLKEFRFLQHKYDLKPLEIHNWKFLRLRPANFPHARIAQLAGMIREIAPAFEKIKQPKSIREMMALFRTKTSEYWLTHSHFGKAHKKRNGTLSQSTLELLVINAITPVLFSYGLYTNEQETKDRVIDLLYALPSEKNNLVKKWRERQIVSGSAATSQALIHLKQAYCDQKRCLSCAIGGKIVMEA